MKPAVNPMLARELGRTAKIVRLELGRSISRKTSTVEGARQLGRDRAASFLIKNLKAKPGKSHLTNSQLNEVREKFLEKNIGEKRLPLETFKVAHSLTAAVENMQGLLERVRQVRVAVEEKTERLAEEKAREPEGEARLFESLFYYEFKRHLGALEQELMRIEAELFKEAKQHGYDSWPPRHPRGHGRRVARRGKK